MNSSELVSLKLIFAPDSIHLQVAEQVSKIKGVTKVLLAQNGAFKGQTAETITDAVLSLQNQLKFTHIVAGATAFGKNVTPRIAAKLDVSPISDIIGVKSQDTFVRTIYAGKMFSMIFFKSFLLSHINLEENNEFFFIDFRKCNSNTQSKRSR